MAFHLSTSHSPNEEHQKILYALQREQRRWDPTIRHELARFTARLWPQRRWLGWVGLPAYRPRRQLQGDQVTWWVERDIPPADRFRCAAYLVHMRLDTKMRVTLSVQSGQHMIPVVPANSAILRIALFQAGSDSPLIIPRQMGDALDP
jgi:hypothetical protein